MEFFERINIAKTCKKVCSGGTPKSTHNEYYGGNIPWLNTKEINFNRIYDTEKYITQLGLDNSSAKWIEANSVIVAMYGATAGKVAITKVPLTTNQACCNLTINEEVADYRFVYYALCNDYIRLSSLANGGAQQNLNAQQIKDFDIPYPNIETQQKIANILSTLDDKIEVNRRINEQLEELAQALFKSWFVDFEPFKDGEFVESELGMIPEGWKVRELSDVLYISKDSINPSKTPDNLFHHYSIPAYDNNKREEAQEGKAIMSNKFKVTNKTTLFSKLNPRIKRVWFIDNVKENAICSTEFVPYKAKNNELTYFVNGLINSDFFYNQAMSIVNGATGSHQRFHPQDTLKFNIAFNESVAKEYSSIVEPIVGKILVNQQEITHLTNFRDTLLPKLMSGEIDVNEVEI